jgi:pyruvate-formate lyase-activating enzyme
LPGINDDRANLAAVGRFVAELAHTRRIHVLPYHAAGTGKQVRLGREVPRHPQETLTDEVQQQTRTWLSSFDLDVQLGG